MQTSLIFLLISFVYCFQTLVFQTNSEASKIIGTYWSPDKDGRIAMYEKNGKYFGKSIWGTKPGKDVKNPNPKLRQREVIGMEFLTDFEYNPKANEYQNGKIYDPRSGKTYDCKMWFGKDGNLRVRGYLGFSMLGMTVVFERIDHKRYDPQYQP